jgi:deoxyribonuclease IV
MPLLGAHMSIAGGLYKAVESAAALGMETVQIFTHSPSQWAVKPVVPTDAESLRVGESLTENNSQWRAKGIEAEDVALFSAALAEHGIVRPIAHASYLINLASGNAELWQKSVEGMVVELNRATQLGIEYVVVHPGACAGICEEEGLANVVRGIDEIHRRVRRESAQILLETTAGQGSCLGCRFEQLRDLLAAIEQGDRAHVCVDTCHIFAAGYPLADRRDYLSTIRELDRTIGLARVKAIHLNDSKRELSSRVDRHANIGHGKLGLEAFRHLLTDRRFRKTPMYLETPKGKNDAGEDWDEINLRTLRELCK